ncbi:hypothetical protein [Methylomonas rhizoryzae]|uniref:hypothetical protein n=1 Tax=Methylomonas rhizoryzae TaxID=2608981 RepID=UPI001231DDE3|nr:hypothetical protein [Methylomonas rhizoryzae]
MITILESGMSFGPFSEDHVFFIEKSPALLELNKSSNKGEGIAIAEFLLIKSEKSRNYISIIEAKTSSPKPGNTEDFDKYIGDIKSKLSNSLHLFVSYYLNRHSSGFSELPNQFKKFSLQNIDFEFILVIKTSEDAWLRPVLDSLRPALKPLMKIWNISPTAIKVFNEAEAIRHQLAN